MNEEWRDIPHYEGFYNMIYQAISFENMRISVLQRK